MCDVCADFLHLLVSYESRIGNADAKHQKLHKYEVEIITGYIQTWPQRQCMCCYRDIKNFDRFNLIVQSMIFLAISQLKDIKLLLDLSQSTAVAVNSSSGNNNNSNNNNNNCVVNSSGNSSESTNTADSNSGAEDETIVDGKCTKKLEKSSENCEKSESQSQQQQSQQQHQQQLQRKPPATDENVRLEDIWTLGDIERLLMLISKAFLLNFPLYIAFKHGIHPRTEDITQIEITNLNMFCDLHDTEISAYLLRNVFLFCNTGGFSVMMMCFDQPNLPVSTAHSITMAVSNLKLWLNYRSIVQLFIPLRNKVLQYMCKLADQDLRLPATKALADFMWQAIKDPLEAQLTFDTEGLALAFKYFTSTTLTMRLAGMAQINAHINLFNEICTSETVAEVETVGQKLADWLSKNQIISHLFGPNLHVEVIKQSHIVLQFLAVENKISEDHINLIWQSAQLKHCSKPIYDLLPSLVKNLAPRPAMHLYSLLCRLDPKEHTEQSIYIASALTKLIWSRDCSRPQSQEVTAAATLAAAAAAHALATSGGGGGGGGSSSENSVSLDGSNSDEHPDEESSEGQKSHIDIEGSDSGPTPCKQPRHKNNCSEETTDESTKIDPDAIDEIKCGKLKQRDRAMAIIRCHMPNQFPDGSSSDDGLSVFASVRKKKKRRRSRAGVRGGGGGNGSSGGGGSGNGGGGSGRGSTGMMHMRKDMMQQSVAAPLSDTEWGGPNDSDCSESQMPNSMMGHLEDGPFISAISESHLMELMSGGENNSYSSPTSNKSEKNMADFDDEDSHCEDELLQFATRAQHCLGGGISGAGFSYARGRPTGISEGYAHLQQQQQRHMDSEMAAKGSKINLGGGKMVGADGTYVRDHPTFKINEVCQSGNTLLWDLLQDDKIGQLGETLALEAEKTLGTLLCFNTDKFIRTKFIEGCLHNLALNKSVVVSLRLLPKLFASFQQFRATDTHEITMWAERQHKMMHHFFNNLKHYMSVKPHQSMVCNQNGGLLYSHLTQVQVRLQFLTSIFSSMGSPDNFRLNLEQVDLLWSWLANDGECADCLFAWLQGHAKGADQHALGLEALTHLYTKRLPELKPEGISMIALGLFQQLCSLSRLPSAQTLIAHFESSEPLDIVGMSHLWKIALRAGNTDVSLAAIQYINSYYMGQQLKLEKEFVAQCMNHLTQAAEDLNSPESEENALMCVQRALMLLNTHLETFRRRYAFHLRRWALEGKGVSPHSTFRNESMGPPLRIVLQPGGLPDKAILHLHTTDLVADLKAEIAKWWETLQGGAKTSGASAPVLGLLLSEGPLRIITQGQEITADYDERSLSDVGFKDNQMVYVSLGGRGGRRREPADHPSLQPPPPKECLPTILLLQTRNFEQLFHLMQKLGDMQLQGKAGKVQPHTKAQLLSRRVWDILALLPTNTDLLNKFKSIGNGNTAEVFQEDKQKLCALLDANNLQKFMYSLHIVESLCKTKYTGCCGNESNLKTIQPKNKGAVQALQGKLRNQPELSVRVEKIEEIVLNSTEFIYDDDEDDKQPKVSIAKEANKEIIKGIRIANETSEEESSNQPQPPQQQQQQQPQTQQQSPTQQSPPTQQPHLPTQQQVRVEESETIWRDTFISHGGLRHLFEIFLSGQLQSEKYGSSDYNEWRYDCLASLLRILCLLGFEDVKREDNLLTVPRLSDSMMSMMSVKPTLRRLGSILNDAAKPSNPHQFKTGFWGRNQVIHFAMNLLVCFVHSSGEAREHIWSEPEICGWLQRFILDDPDPAVRREACAGLYRICLGNAKMYNELIVPLLTKLISFLPIAEKMTSQNQQMTYSPEDGKDPYGPACRDYFWLLSRLVDTLSPELVKESLEDPANAALDIEAMCKQVSRGVLERDFLETRHGTQDDGLVGLLNLMGNLVKYDPPFKFSQEGQDFIGKIFDCLFDLPSSQNRHKPKCKSQSARAASYDLLVEMCRKAPKNYIILHSKLLLQHSPGPQLPHPWDYWPRDDGRSECGYVGLTNLGATCYMASCIQHLYMMPQARQALLSIPPQAAQKHATTLHELQRMFAYLMESERKSYNPRSFCRVYQMDHQPLNTGEQKDMAEFFIDLVSKLEDMTPDLKSLIKQLFCGTLSNNVVSLDCGHVSRTLEEFYTVRCQVADMRDLHESLDEVTVKDTLEGDNMYTCSQCGRKVRAEKRACFKKLPQILCFNTMRYTFNMITMLKEKVNTHFSFPMRLDMSGYVEKTLMPQQYQEEKQKQQTKRMNAERTNSETENNPNLNNTIDGETSERSPDAGCKKQQQPSKGEDCGNVSDEDTKSAGDDEENKTDEHKLKEDSEDEFSEHFEYDLVGVTVHTGTADGGHYYSFIKERSASLNPHQQDRWFLFNDAEVKIFDPSQLATECFGGEMTSKTYDSVTEKYLDFSFEKTNSAYMLFYERRPKNDPFRNDCGGPSNEFFDIGNFHNQLPGCSSAIAGCISDNHIHNNQLIQGDVIDGGEATGGGAHPNHNLYRQHHHLSDIKSESSNSSGCHSTSSNCSTSSNSSRKKDPPGLETDNLSSELILHNLGRTKCDIDVKGNSSCIKSKNKHKHNNMGTPMLSKELEDWIWQDNRHFLQDRNIFEHTYFNFMWQICGHIPQTLLLQTDVSCIAAQLSVSFFIETFIHAKEKPTMVLWVELLTKQFNASQEACEWFLTHMSTEPWWPVQVLIQCPNQMVRQMFQRLVIHVIQRLRQSHYPLYLKADSDDEGRDCIGNASCVTRFVRSLILLMEHGAKPHLRHLSEFFGLLYEFTRMGEEETMFLLRINVIRSVVDFYLGHKSQDCIETGSDNDDNSSDETLSVDKARPASLDKMIALVALLVERSRGSDLRLRLSSRDYNAITAGKGFPFLYQQIKDNINPHQTRHLIHALCRFDERLANQIITMLFSTVTKHSELCGPFFKLLTLLTESSGGPSGLPCFSQLVLQRVWEAAEFCPQSALDWLAVQAPRNKIVHGWILQSSDSWVEQFLMAHNNSRVRNAAAYLLVSLVPSQSFRSNYRTTSLHKLPLHTPQRELNNEAQLILHTILNLLLRLLRAARPYAEISIHGTGKLTSYFTLMTYCMVSKTEKSMLCNYIRPLWELFHPRLSEPSVPAHHNKQALLAFWHHATTDCPENAAFVANCPDITRNIAFNYILADHDDTEIVGYNRAMLPAYYGLLRLCCQQSRSLTRQMAAHQNLQWAFKNITPHPTQYAMAVDELFRLMTLFATRQPDSTEAEQREISTFRKTTLTAYLSGLDARVSWGTLIAAFRILVDNEEDRLFVVFHGGIAMCFEALHTLHSMYHEATACHVSGDLQELLGELVFLVRTLRINSREQKKRPPPLALKGLQDALRRLVTLLNTYNPPEMRNLTMDVLKELVRNTSLDVISVLGPHLLNCHMPNSVGFLGPYFPRRGTKAPWPPVTKSNPRPPRPMVQMSLPLPNIVQKGIDKEFDAALLMFYKPYHDFLDVMMRMAVNMNQLDESLVNLSCLAGIEGASLHFNLFPKFWVGIFNNKNTFKYVELLVNNSNLVDYIDTVIKDERYSLNDPIILSFLDTYYSKITSRLAIPRLVDSICSNIASKESYEEIYGEVAVLRIIAQSSGIPSEILQKQIQCSLSLVLEKLTEDLNQEEETPPKKRKMNTSITKEDGTVKQENANDEGDAPKPETTETVSDSPIASTEVVVSAEKDASIETPTATLTEITTTEAAEIPPAEPSTSSATMLVEECAPEASASSIAASSKKCNPDVGGDDADDEHEDEEMDGSCTTEATAHSLEKEEETTREQEKSLMRQIESCIHTILKSIDNESDQLDDDDEDDDKE